MISRHLAHVRVLSATQRAIRYPEFPDTSLLCFDENLRIFVYIVYPIHGIEFLQRSFVIGDVDSTCICVHCNPCGPTSKNRKSGVVCRDDELYTKLCTHGTIALILCGHLSY